MENKKSESKKQEECYLCGKLCAAKGLKAHIRSHTNITIYDCDECGHRFSTKKLLQQHKITHRTHYLCVDCNGKYKDTEHLRKHKCIPVMEQRECKFCGKFCAPKGLMPHIRSHANHNNYACEDCGNKFSSKKKLNKHKTTHKTYYTCDECNGKYRNPEHLKHHACIYGKERNHFCEFCGKAFFTKYDLTRHVRIHTNEKPYVCDICGKGFTQKSNHDSHYRTHLKDTIAMPPKERKFVCEICFKAFFYKQHLKRHNLVHTKERPFQCDTCFKSFSQKSYLKLHVLIHTNERPFKCDKCDRRFPCKWRLVQHEKRHEAPSIDCNICGKGFYMPSDYDRHLLIHTKAKPYICDICHKGFTARWTLKNHYLNHVNKKRARKRKFIQDSEEEENKDDIQQFIYDTDLFPLEEKPHPCHVCKTIFQDEESLDGHTAEHMEELKCCMCGEYHNDAEKLLIHHRIHEIPLIEKPYVCFLNSRT